jgi:hypothetical protein
MSSKESLHDTQGGNRQRCQDPVTAPSMVPMSSSRFPMEASHLCRAITRQDRPFATVARGFKYLYPANRGKQARTSTLLSQVLRKRSRQAPQTVTGKAATAQTIHTVHPARYPSPDHSKSPANPVSDQTPDQSDPYAGCNPMQ